MTVTPAFGRLGQEVCHSPNCQLQSGFKAGLNCLVKLHHKKEREKTEAGEGSERYNTKEKTR